MCVPVVAVPIAAMPPPLAARRNASLRQVTSEENEPVSQVRMTANGSCRPLFMDMMWL